MKLNLNAVLNQNTNVINTSKSKDLNLIIEHCIFLNAMNEESFAAKNLITRVLAFNGFNPTSDINSLHKESALVVNKYKSQIDTYAKIGIDKLSALKYQIREILTLQSNSIHNFNDTLAFKVNGYKYTLENDVPKLNICDRLNTQFNNLATTNISAEKILDEYIEKVKNEQYKNVVRAEILNYGDAVTAREYTPMLFKSFRNNSDKIDIIINKSELEYYLLRLSDINNTILELTALKNDIIKQITLMQDSIESCYKMDNNTGVVYIPEIGLNISIYNKDSLYKDNVQAIKTLLDVKYNELEFMANAYTTAFAYRVSALVEEHVFLINMCNEAYRIMKINKGGER